MTATDKPLAQREPEGTRDLAAFLHRQRREITSENIFPAISSGQQI